MLKKWILVFIVIAAVSASASTRYWVEPDKCSGCGDCTAVCPVDAIHVVDGTSHIDPEACISCGLCQEVCTYDAIQ